MPSSLSMWSLRANRGVSLSEATSHHLLIADDHPLFRGALREAVNGLFDRVEIAEAGTFEEVTELLERGGESIWFCSICACPACAAFPA